jgi:hypothetical protein
MALPRAADVAKRRIGQAARRLGTRNPVDAIGGLLDRSFELPVGDPRYGNNSLLPGSLPLEHSFSEVASNAFRLDMEPLGPQATPHARQQEASREMRRLVSAAYGKPALEWFDERSEPWRGSRIHGHARFGAWFGAGFDADGLQEAKAYYELAPGQLDDLPFNLQHAARVAMSCLPGLVPIFTSIACGRVQGHQRLYFYHQGDLRLLDLEPMMNRLGIGHQLPSLLTAIGLILGGRFTLPEGSVVIALRDTTRGIEMKLEILLPGIPDPPREMHGLIQLHLSQRPEAQRALSQWLRAMVPDDAGSAGDMTVVSVRVSPQVGGRLTLYFRPVGYDAPSSRQREVPVSGRYDDDGGADPYSISA